MLLQVVIGTGSLPAPHHSLPMPRNVEMMKALALEQGIAGEAGIKWEECLGTFPQAIGGAHDTPVPTFEKSECQEMFTQVLVGETHAPAFNIRRNGYSEAFPWSVAGARGSLMSHVENVKSLVIG